MKKIMKKIISTISRPFKFLKKKLENPVNFIKEGKNGGMILCALLAMQFLYASLFIDLRIKVPAFLLLLLALIIFCAVTELVGLLLKLVLGGTKRNRLYLINSFIVLLLINLLANQLHTVFPAIILCFSVAFSIYLFGSCIWAFIKTKRFKQVFGYVISAVSLIVIILFAIFFKKDDFGESRIRFYLDAVTRGECDAVDGFSQYLENGDYVVRSFEYGPEEEADIVTELVDISYFASRSGLNGMLSSILAGYSLEEAPVAGKIWFPEGQTQCPVLFFVHGNHDAGVPSYLGYEYLGEYLASHGYVVVSVDENVINGLTGENDARAVLLLENISAILKENSDESSPIYNIIDTDRIAIGGHSRGGEMVALAYLFNDLDYYPDNYNIKFNYHYNITSIVAIAPTVDQYQPGDHSVEISDVNYLLIHGSNDQDVSFMMGEKQYDNIDFTPFGEEDYFKASVYIMGANHGQFNELWGRYDIMPAANGFLNTANFIEEYEQKLIAKAYIRVFLDATLNGDDTYASLMYDNEGYLSYLPETIYITNYMDSSFVRCCAFDDYLYSKSMVKVNCYGMSNAHAHKDVYGTSGEAENYVLMCRWNEGSEPVAKIEFEETDLSSGIISFRIADMREDAEINTPLYYEVVLSDDYGNEVSAVCPVLIYPSLAVQLYKEDVLFNCFEYKHQMGTVRVSTSLFEGDENFDFTSVDGIFIYFDGSSEGSVIIDDIGYYE